MLGLRQLSGQCMVTISEDTEVGVAAIDIGDAVVAEPLDLSLKPLLREVADFAFGCRAPVAERAGERGTPDSSPMTLPIGVSPFLLAAT